jgi:hypothetical protein
MFLSSIPRLKPWAIDVWNVISLALSRSFGI